MLVAIRCHTFCCGLESSIQSVRAECRDGVIFHRIARIPAGSGNAPYRLDAHLNDRLGRPRLDHLSGLPVFGGTAVAGANQRINTGVGRRVDDQFEKTGAQLTLCENNLAYPHRLRIHKFMYPQPGQFASVAGSLHAAEGQARIGFDHAVDEGGAGLNARR